MSTPDITSVVNTILANGSTDFQTRVPAATKENLVDVGNAILNYAPFTNEFLTGMLNKIVMQLVTNKRFSNPLALLKKGTKPLGFDIEHSYTNPATAAVYDRTGANLLATNAPDVKTEYFRLNRKDRYKVTVWTDDIRHAFTSFESMNNLIDSITGSLYNGDFIDEFTLMKNLFAQAMVDQKMITASITAVTTSETAAAALLAFKNLASGFQYPSTSFNAWAKAGGSGNAVTTLCPKEEQILIVRSDILNYIDVMVLAGIFNMDKAEIKNRIIETDNFGFAANCIAIIADQDAIHVWDDKNESPPPFQNSEGLYFSYFWHHWQTLAMSLLKNCVAIVDDATADAAPVLTDASAKTGGTVITGTGVATHMLVLQVWNTAETVLIEEVHGIVAAGNTWSVTLDSATIKGQHIIVYQVDAAGNRSPADTFTVVDP